MVGQWSQLRENFISFATLATVWGWQNSALLAQLSLAVPVPNVEPGRSYSCLLDWQCSWNKASPRWWQIWMGVNHLLLLICVVTKTFFCDTILLREQRHAFCWSLATLWAAQLLVLHSGSGESQMEWCEGMGGLGMAWVYSMNEWHTVLMEEWC